MVAPRPIHRAFEGLELPAAKVARAVLRGRGGSDVALLPEHYESEIILLCVRWYLRYALSFRDLEMMRDRGLSLDHTTIYRWVQALLRSWRKEFART
jgi:transposase-like protein